MNTHEYYVSLEVAKLLKEAGFDWETFAHWTESDINNPDFKFSGLSDKPILYDGHISIDKDACIGSKKDWNNYNNECPLIYNYSAPTLDVAQRWLRENKDFDINVLTDFDSVKRLYYVRYVVKDGHYKTYYISNNRSYVYFNTYEEALEAGIKKALEIILEKRE